MAKVTPEQKALDYAKAVELVLEWDKTPTPNMANATPNTIMDSMGYLGELEKACEKTKKILRGIYDSMGPSAKVSGDVFEGSKTVADRTALDQTKAKEYFEKAGLLPEYMKTTSVETLKINRK